MESKCYTFVHVSNRVCSVLEEKGTKELLMKWSMKGTLQVHYYSFNQPFHAHKKQEFVESFFADPVVYSSFRYNQSPIGKAASSVRFESIPCTILSMEFFDRLLDPENGIVRCDKNSIVQCQEECVESFLIDDNLRNVILNGDSEFYALYSDSDRKQFLWNMFCHLCLGGEWCQYEFSIEPYLKVAKLLYKDVVSVERIGASSELVVRSVVLKVEAYDEDKEPLAPTQSGNVQNFVYLVIDPFKRSVTVLSHCYGVYCV